MTQTLTKKYYYNCLKTNYFVRINNKVNTS